MSKRILAILVAIVTATVALAGCSSSGSSSQSSGKKTLTLATDANYPPCESMSGSKMIGFEPDIWNAIAGKLGYSLKLVNTDFDSLIPGVQTGRYDLTMECISDNPDREKQVTFLDFIYAADAIITTHAHKGPITASNPLSVCGLTMGAQSGFDTVSVVKDKINPKCVKAGKKTVSVQTYPSAAATYNALYSGRVDFVIQDTAAATILQKSAPVKLDLVDNSLLPRLYLGIVFQKSNTKLIKQWQKGLGEIIADGTYAKVLKKWKLSDLALKPGINLATKKPITD